MYYPSKRDSWLIGVMVIFIFLFTVPPFFVSEFGVFMIPRIIETPVVRMAIRIIPAGLLLWVLLQTGYNIKNQTLHITFGPIRKKISIQEIHKIEKTKDPFVAPALSSNRLIIHYGHFQFISISPKDQNEFIQNLCEKNPAIKVNKNQ